MTSIDDIENLLLELKSIKNNLNNSILLFEKKVSDLKEKIICVDTEVSKVYDDMSSILTSIVIPQSSIVEHNLNLLQYNLKNNYEEQVNNLDCTFYPVNEQKTSISIIDSSTLYNSLNNKKVFNFTMKGSIDNPPTDSHKRIDLCNVFSSNKLQRNNENSSILYFSIKLLLNYNGGNRLEFYCSRLNHVPAENIFNDFTDGLWIPNDFFNTTDIYTFNVAFDLENRKFVAQKQHILTVDQQIPTSPKAHRIKWRHRFPDGLHAAQQSISTAFLCVVLG